MPPAFAKEPGHRAIGLDRDAGADAACVDDEHGWANVEGVNVAAAGKRSAAQGTGSVLAGNAGARDGRIRGSAHGQQGELVIEWACVGVNDRAAAAPGATNGHGSQIVAPEHGEAVGVEAAGRDDFALGCELGDAHAAGNALHQLVSGERAFHVQVLAGELATSGGFEGPDGKGAVLIDGS